MPDTTRLKTLLEDLLADRDLQDQFFDCSLTLMADRRYNLTPYERALLFKMDETSLAQVEPGVATHDLDDDWDLSGRDFPVPQTPPWTDAQQAPAACTTKTRTGRPGTLEVLELGFEPWRAAGGGSGGWGAPAPGVRRTLPGVLRAGRTARLVLSGEGLLPEAKILLTRTKVRTYAEFQSLGTDGKELDVERIKWINFHRVYLETESFTVPDWSEDTVRLYVLHDPRVELLGCRRAPTIE